MKILLFFGSFNPIHIGHLIVAKEALNKTDCDKLWFVVSPQNPFKEKKSLLGEKERKDLLLKAIKGIKEFKISDIEFNLPKPSYTITTLNTLNKKYKDYQFSILLGSDNLKKLPTWKNADKIIQKHKIYIYPRLGYNYGTLKNHPKIKILSLPFIEISSTSIRNKIALNESITFLTPTSVEEEIKKKGYYNR